MRPRSLFTVASKTIQVKLHKDGDSDATSVSHLKPASTPFLTVMQDSDELSSKPTLTRTSTGLISNKRPIIGTPASSGCSTPTPSTTAQLPRTNLLAIAKRESARKGLYARFFRGPILGPEILSEDGNQDSGSSSSFASPEASSSKSQLSTSAISPQLVIEVESKTEMTAVISPERREKEKANKKESKEERRRRKESKRKGKDREAVSSTNTSTKTKGKRKRKQADEERIDAIVIGEGGDIVQTSSKKRKRKLDGDSAVSDERKRKKEKKRKREIEAGPKGDGKESKKGSKEERRKRKEERKRFKEDLGKT